MQTRRPTRVSETARLEALVVGHLPRVRRIADQVHRHLTHVPLNDLVQTGVLGLLQSDRRYRPADGDFEAFSYRRIRGSMIDAHNRRKYRDETHDSLDAIEGRLGYLPAYLSTDAAPLPDDIRAPRQESLDLGVHPGEALDQAQAGIFGAVWLLPVSHGRVIASLYSMGLSVEETSRRMDVSTSQVRMLHRDALVMLRPAAEGLL